jgi:integrase
LPVGSAVSISKQWQHDPVPLADEKQREAHKRAVAKYEERFAEPAPEGFRTLHVHDLRHTVGRRLRAAGVSLETRQAILGHKSGSITTHYSAAELRELVDAMEFIATDNVRESHALTLLKRKAG